MLYLPIPIWRPSAILEKSSFLLLKVLGRLVIERLITGRSITGRLTTGHLIIIVHHQNALKLRPVIKHPVIKGPCTVAYTIFTCNTFNVHDFGIYNLFLMLFLSSAIIINIIYLSRCPDNPSQDNSSGTIRRRTIHRGQFVADNSSRTIRRGRFVAKYKINFIRYL